MLKFMAMSLHVASKTMVHHAPSVYLVIKELEIGGHDKRGSLCYEKNWGSKPQIFDPNLVLVPIKYKLGDQIDLSMHARLRVAKKCDSEKRPCRRVKVFE